MLVFGSYLIIVDGVVMGFFPHHILTILSWKADNDTFVRMTGLLAAILRANHLLMNLLLLAFGDAMAATWTFVALRKDQQENENKQKNSNKKN
ncbi:unnamed protein product [Rotaria sp. Silwood1]|nr:unnamed protein product [Rotaria sp. Silwood1]CAF1395674.1 unnamed protein product [Rotaria sp. Silwood1]CAF3570397.1 unnamed protein product [Rotaria sp. Silwood1]CAF4958034.1 unnamed protein product [Rotaria sp. Silwood1]